MEEKKVVIFKVASGEYSIDVSYVISIEKEEQITPVPQLPSFVKGIRKVRDELIPVIDLQMVLYNQRTEENETNKLIVVRTEDISFAMIVHDAKEIIDIKEEVIKEVGISAYQKTEYITGVLNLEKRLVLMLDPTILIETLDGVREIKDYMKNQPA
ncbi:chemotaxis protein CheW [Niallia sp. Sow4_A1]|jgi:purine-binding chemotaxis protein CheW|uniref:Chemotaxis protein CheW n=1 Tax=Niallia hominis TaxID=3133173 RepID=A0ABV1F4M3_9BACI|nr:MULTISPECIES: chemotaxis protein CheW [Bacillaceae]MCF2649793.1 purine-binding chemotaxis protein CheW [Niallia circulans]MCM3362944.1 chemotaxis protein CheW [Niallia sp. MER TA 168]CAI9388953.1 Chemotaxis protein CheW [Bacillus sp. T2.9-1]